MTDVVKGSFYDLHLLSKDVSHRHKGYFVGA